MATRTVRLPAKMEWNERAYRDQLNGIVRNKDGQIIKMNGRYTYRGVDEALCEDKIWSK